MSLLVFKVAKQGFFFQNALQMVFSYKTSENVQILGFFGRKKKVFNRGKSLVFFKAAECCLKFYKCLSKDFLLESSQNVQKQFFGKLDVFFRKSP